MIRARTKARLRADIRAATLVEFAIVCPVALLVIMGLCDLCYRSYAQSLLTGAVQRSARDATIEGSSTTLNNLDQRVVTAVQQIAKNATWSSTRKSYKSFSDVKPEPFTDSNDNKKYDVGECYSDINGNSQWDSDPGADNQGGANDVTLYTMTISYPRIFPVALLWGGSPKEVISSQTILKNQPYGVQVPSDPVTICT